MAACQAVYFSVLFRTSQNSKAIFGDNNLTVSVNDRPTNLAVNPFLEDRGSASLKFNSNQHPMTPKTPRAMNNNNMMMMPSTMTTNIYFATPLEQTYSLYLAQQIFGVILPVAGSVSMKIHLDISGQKVVQLMTQSQVPRPILRALWNVADPENSGSLRSLPQFQLLLRLVSLSQAGTIPQDESVADLSLDGLRVLVQQTAHLKLNLPTFANVIMPTNVQLSQMYGYLVVSPTLLQQQQQQQAQLQTQSIDDAFGNLVKIEDAPLPSLGAVPPIVVDEPIGKTNDDTGAQTWAPAASYAAAADNNDDNDDFGRFEEADPAATSTIVDFSAQNVAGAVAEDFPVVYNGLDRIITTTTTTTGPKMTVSTVNDLPEPYSFGTMEMSASDKSVSGHAATNLVSGVSEISDFSPVVDTTSPAHDSRPPVHDPTSSPSTAVDPFSGIDPVTNEPRPKLELPKSSFADSQQVNENDDDDFGGFESGKSTSELPSAAMSSSFGQTNQDVDFAAVGSTASMSMQFGAHEISGTTQSMAIDAFDAFSEINSTVQDAPLTTLENVHTTSASASAADEPTDSLNGELTSGAPLDVTEPDNDNGDDIEFGDFGSASDQSSAITLFADKPQTSGGQNPDDLLNSNQPFMTDTVRSVSEPVQAPAIPAIAHNGRSLSMMDDLFGGIGTIQDDPLPLLAGPGAACFSVQNSTPPDRITGPTESNIPDIADRDFGSFEDATSTIDYATSIPSNPERTFSMLDPFSSMSPGEDTHLPPLSSYSYDSNQMVEASGNGEFVPTTYNGNDDDEVFGGLSAVGASKDPLSTGAVSSDVPPSTSSFNAFDNEGVKVTDRTLPDLKSFGGIESSAPVGNVKVPEQAKENPLVEECDDDDFGGFESATSTEDQPKAIIDENAEGLLLSSEWLPPPMTDLGPAFSAPGSFTSDKPHVNEIRRSMSTSDTPEIPKISPEDLFGVSEGTTLSPSSRPDEQKSAPKAAPAPESDEFGVFSALSQADNIEQDQKNSAIPTQESNFGAFDQPYQQPSVAPNNDKDEFGVDFGDFSAAYPANDQESIFGVFDQPGQQSSVVPSNDKDELGADFGGDFSAAGPAEIQESQFGVFDQQEKNFSVVTNNDKDEFRADFGDFSAASPANDQESHFGVFDQQEKNFSVVTNKDKDEFGTFAGSDEPIKADESDAADDDWGDFENVSCAVSHASDAASSEPSERIQWKEIIRSISAPFLLTDISGANVDLGYIFDANVGIESNIDVSRVERCIQILKSVSPKLVSTWTQIMSVIVDEIEGGRKIMSGVKSLSEKDLRSVHVPIRTMCAGLAEYMRITRSIVATIGDVLLLDKTALLTIDTFSHTWCSLAILQPALEIESKWKALQKELHPMFKPEFTNVATLEDIRSRTLMVQKSEDADFYCQLTLQPLLSEDKATTKAAVEWQGQTFMACSANFLANRCPFFVPESK